MHNAQRITLLHRQNSKVIIIFTVQGNKLSAALGLFIEYVTQQAAGGFETSVTMREGKQWQSRYVKTTFRNF